QRPASVDLYGLGVRAVDVGVDAGLPRVLQVLRQLGVDRRRADRDRRGHDQRRLVFHDPQRVDDGVHEAQHAARALEALEARPVLVQAVEQLWVNRKGLLDAILVAAIPRIAREVVGVAVVHLHEAASRRVDRRERVGVGRDEQPLADDVVSLVWGRWAPLIGDAPYDVLQAL